MRLILNDGTVIENGGAGDAGRTLWLYVPGATMQAGWDIASDTGKTARIVHEYGDQKDVYEGYTRCTALMDEDTQVAIGLKKAVSE